MSRMIFISLWLLGAIVNIALYRPRSTDKGDQSITTYILWYVFAVILGPIGLFGQSKGSNLPPSDGVA